MNSNNNSNNLSSEIEFLDFVTMASFLTQIFNMETEDNTTKRIEEKLDIIINKLNKIELILTMQQGIRIQ